MQMYDRKGNPIPPPKPLSPKQAREFQKFIARALRRNPKK